MASIEENDVEVNGSDDDIATKILKLKTKFLTTLTPEEKKQAYLNYKEALVEKLKSDTPYFNDYKARDDLITTLVDNNPDIENFMYGGEGDQTAIKQIPNYLTGSIVKGLIWTLSLKTTDIDGVRSSASSIIGWVKGLFPNAPTINFGEKREKAGTIPENVQKLLDYDVKSHTGISHDSLSVLDKLLESETFRRTIEGKQKQIETPAIAAVEKNNTILLDDPIASKFVALEPPGRKAVFDTYRKNLIAKIEKDIDCFASLEGTKDNIFQAFVNKNPDIEYRIYESTVSTEGPYKGKVVKEAIKKYFDGDWWKNYGLTSPRYIASKLSFEHIKSTIGGYLGDLGLAGVSLGESGEKPDALANSIQNLLDHKKLDNTDETTLKTLLQNASFKEAIDGHGKSVENHPRWKNPRDLVALKEQSIEGKKENKTWTEAIFSFFLAPWRSFISIFTPAKKAQKESLSKDESWNSIEVKTKSPTGKKPTEPNAFEMLTGDTREQKTPQPSEVPSTNQTDSVIISTNKTRDEAIKKPLQEDEYKPRWSEVPESKDTNIISTADKRDKTPTNVTQEQPQEDKRKRHIDSIEISTRQEGESTKIWSVKVEPTKKVETAPKTPAIKDTVTQVTPGKTPRH